MGNNQSPKWADRSEWKQVGHQNHNEPGRPTLVQLNNNLSIVGQRYSFDIPNADIQRQVKIYKLRKQSHSNIVGVYEYEVIQNCWCAMGSQSWKVITEHTPQRLASIVGLVSCESIHILNECLKGYQQLWKHYKIGYLTSNMIGIGENGNVKVWVNEDWSLNECKHIRNEKAIIQQIIALVQDKCIERSLEIQMLKKIVPFNFYHLVSYLNTKFTKQITQGKHYLGQRIQKPKYVEHHHNISNSQNLSSTTPSPSLQPSNVTTTAQTHERRHHSCNINGQKHKKTNTLNSPILIIPNTKLTQSVYHSAQKNRSNSSTIQRHSNKYSSEKKQRCVSPNIVLNTIKYKNVKQQNIIFHNEEFRSRSERRGQSGLGIGQQIKTKKYINFFYSNASPDRNRKTTQDGHINSERVPLSRGKVGREKNKEQILKKHVEEMNREPQIDAFDLGLQLNELGTWKSEPREVRKEGGYREGLIREVESLQLSGGKQQFQTPSKSEMGAKEVVEEFKFYLRCTPTEKADEMVQDKVENGVIMERQGQEDD